MIASTSTRCFFVPFVVASFLVSSAASSKAAPITANNLPTITVDAEDFAGPPWEYSPALDVLENLPDRGRKLGVPVAESNIQGNRAHVEITRLEFDPDPFVLNNILITNPTAATQIYTVGIALPTVFPGPNIISGNVRTDVIDGGGAAGGTVASVAGFPIYSAQIDFGTVATLQSDPFSIVAPAAGSASSPAAFGPTVNAVPVTSNIGIELRFSLTAGDTASILSRFDVVAIPEAASLTLAAIGFVVAALGFRRCR